MTRTDTDLIAALTAKAEALSTAARAANALCIERETEIGDPLEDAWLDEHEAASKVWQAVAVIDDSDARACCMLCARPYTRPFEAATRCDKCQPEDYEPEPEPAAVARKSGIKLKTRKDCPHCGQTNNVHHRATHEGVAYWSCGLCNHLSPRRSRRTKAQIALQTLRDREAAGR